MHNKNNNKSQTFIQGLRPFASSIPKTLKKHLRKGGYNYSNIVVNWTKMVGKEISDICYPSTIKMGKNMKDGTLTLNVQLPTIPSDTIATATLGGAGPTTATMGSIPATQSITQPGVGGTIVNSWNVNVLVSADQTWCLIDGNQGGGYRKRKRRRTRRRSSRKYKSKSKCGKRSSRGKRSRNMRKSRCRR